MNLRRFLRLLQSTLLFVAWVGINALYSVIMWFTTRKVPKL